MPATIDQRPSSRDMRFRDRDAETYQAYALELTRYATMLVGPHDACDVVATAVLSCMSTAGWGEVENQRAYLYRAVGNEARRALRRRARRVDAEASAPRRPERFDMVDGLDVRAALARLSVRQRGVVYLTYWADLTPAGCAVLLGISEGAVRRYLRRARRQLKEVLGER